MVLPRVEGAVERKEGGRGGGRAGASRGSVEDWACKAEKRTLRLLEFGMEEKEEEEDEEKEEEGVASKGEKRICLLLRRVLPVRLRGVFLSSPLFLLLFLVFETPLPEEGNDDDDDGGGGGGGTNEEHRPLLMTVSSPRCLLLIGCPDVVAIHLLLPAPTLPVELAVGSVIKMMERRIRIIDRGTAPVARHLDCCAGGIAACSVCILWK